jgi:pimeloyl-ACP methyl ester carboxylesterase
MRVVLVHGTMDRGSSFARVRAQLPEFDVVTYDRRGYGRRAADPPGSFSDHVDELLAHVGATPSVVVGHSIGGDIAMAAACRAPGAILAIGAWEPPLAWLPWWPQDSAGTVAVGEAATPELAAELFMRGVVGDDVWDGLPEETRAARRAEGVAMVVDVEAIRDTAPFDVDDVTVPMIVGRGTRSKWYHQQSADWFVENAAAELFTIDGANHGAHTSHVMEFADFVRRTAALA